MVGIIADRTAPDWTPAKFGRPKALLAGQAGSVQRLLRCFPEQPGRIRQFWIAGCVSQQRPDWLASSTAQKVPHCHFNARHRVRRLQQVHAVIRDLRGHPGDIRRRVQVLAQDRVLHGPANAMRHRADKGGNGGQGRSFALAPSHMAARRNPHEKGILAAICLGRDNRHGHIEEIDGLYLHVSLARSCQVTTGLNATSWSSGYMGRAQTVCPRLFKSALVEPGASILKFFSAH